MSSSDGPYRRNLGPDIFLYMSSCVEELVREWRLNGSRWPSSGFVAVDVVRSPLVIVVMVGVYLETNICSDITSSA